MSFRSAERVDGSGPFTQVHPSAGLNSKVFGVASEVHNEMEQKSNDGPEQIPLKPVFLSLVFGHKTAKEREKWRFNPAETLGSSYDIKRSVIPLASGSASRRFALWVN
jgi:hypothetical protein